MTKSNIITFKKTNLININLKHGRNYKIQNFIKILASIFIGFINGFCGGGGGMVLVPTLTFICNKEDKVAHATAIFVMLPLTIVSVVIYFIKNTIDIKLSFIISIGFILGGVLGGFLLKKLKNIWIEIIFTIVILYCGVRMLF